MSPYALALFCHVASVAGLFAALAIEWVSASRLTRSATYERAREWSGLWSLLIALGMPSTLVALGTGIYMATAFHLWAYAWVAVAVPTLVMVALAGGIVGPRRSRVRAALEQGEGVLPVEMQAQLRHPLFVASLRCRTALLVGLLFVMTVRPQAALLVIAAFALTGITASAPAWRTLKTNEQP